MSDRITKYGRTWKPLPHPGFIDLYIYAMPALREELGEHAMPREDHLKAAISAFWTEDQFRLKGNTWANRMIDLWCNTPVSVVWGCSGSGKSTTAGVILLADLLAAPSSTYTCVVTSPQKEHPNRTWGNVVRYYNMLPSEIRPGKIKQAPLGLHTTSTDKRAGIHCYSTEEGESVEDFKKRVGAHQKRNRFFVDEAQKCNEAILSAASNLGSIGEFQEGYIFNPASWFTADGKVSMPKEPLTIQDMERDEPDEWDLKRTFRGVHGKGICLDGERSPALTDHTLEGILIDRHHRDTIAQNAGEDSFEFWSQFRGRMPPEGAVETFISRQDLAAAGCLEKVESKLFEPGTQVTDILGLDPSEGRDDCCLCRIQVGQRRSDGQTIIALRDIKQVEIRLKQGDISGQIATQTIDWVTKWQIPVKMLAVDATGGTAQSDTIERMIGQKGVARILWQGPASKRKISAAQQTAHDTYNDKATEMFAQIASLCRQGRIVGLNDKIAHQLTTRRKLIQTGRTKVEPKDGKNGWRTRNDGKSPNDLDSLICAVEHAVAKHLIKTWMPVTVKTPNPGFNRFPGGKKPGPPDRVRRMRKASALQRRH